VDDLRLGGAAIRNYKGTQSKLNQVALKNSRYLFL